MIRFKIKLLFLGALLQFSCGKKEKEQSTTIETERPNIIWLVAEDVSPRFSAYGDSLAYTPNLNKIFEKSIIFENAFTTAGVCAPSRSSIISGMYPTSIGTQHMRQKPSVIPMPGFPKYNAVPPPNVKAFPELLRAAGYWTASYKKLDYQFGEPFTIWDEVTEKPSWRHRTESQQKDPFFIYYTFEITHEINIWPDSTKNRFIEEFNLDRKRMAADVAERPYYDTLHKVTPDLVEVPPFLPDTEISRDHIARLYNNISRMDHQIGEIMKQLKEDGLLDNTIIFFMSDHGDCLPRSKRWIYDSGIKSPLTIYIPEKYLPEGVEQPARIEDLISYIDLAPTVLNMAGAEVPEWIQGKEIFNELYSTPREYIYAGRDRMDNRYDTRRAVRDNQYKYIYNYNPEQIYSQQITFLNQMPLMHQIWEMEKAGKLNRDQSYWLDKPKPKEELFDIQKDPFELNNLAEDEAYKPVLERMRTALKDWQNEYGDWEDTPETEQAEKMWPGGKQPLTANPVIKKDGDKIEISCPTEGASIAYKFNENENWKIYTAPVSVEDKKQIFVKSVRYGYKASDTITQVLEN
ncbi:sulfatase-like hydrolase/transferase [Galbibacter sp. BG1]|uniref:sulfatase family protein n=1 Tax=Galbibacter sp. BG1 TaxID=1170699 RepID=UPI0015B99E5D|nr:sulfatase [Galbibacter sp. BG1]QLE02196.1 sulfatase-like hydrolase/transferase [Galbibacter sp. BG1]